MDLPAIEDVVASTARGAHDRGSARFVCVDLLQLDPERPGGHLRALSEESEDLAEAPMVAAQDSQALGMPDDVRIEQLLDGRHVAAAKRLVALPNEPLIPGCGLDHVRCLQVVNWN